MEAEVLLEAAAAQVRVAVTVCLGHRKLDTVLALLALLLLVEVFQAEAQD